MIGKTSTMGSKGAYASGNFESNIDMGSGERGILDKEIERMEGRVAGKVAAIPPLRLREERAERAGERGRSLCQQRVTDQGKGALVEGSVFGNPLPPLPLGEGERGNA